MTEFEINKAVAEKLGIQHCTSGGKVYKILSFSPDSQPLPTEFDPCNRASQAWEIMLKYNICVTQGDGAYEAFGNLYLPSSSSCIYCVSASHKKPLVAAMLCLLEI